MTIEEVINKYGSLDDLLENATPYEIEIYIESIRPPCFGENYQDEKHW